MRPPVPKVRPAAVLLDTGDDDFVAAPVTSAPPRSGFDVVIADWRQAGLNVSSTIRVHKLTVLAKPEILRIVGTLTEPLGRDDPLKRSRPRILSRTGAA